MSAIADAILAARRARQVLQPLGADSPADTAAGYAAQRALAERVGAVPPAGFKIGATTKQMQDYLGLAGPAAGFVAAAGLHGTPARLRYADFHAPGAECEVALRLGRDLPAGTQDEAAIADAVAEVFAAIEIVERRYGDLGELGTPTLIADQVFHAGGVLGAPVRDWRGLDLGAVRGRITVDGEARGEGRGADLLGHPLRALRWLAGSEAAAAFGGLRAGQVVFLGSVTPPIWLDGPCRVVVAFDSLGEVSLALD
ncbi:fumarylacetoacetate hydrolase family protein [Roseomonas sp. NAR14]|uniref:Fumarylacetoacetate hydrolase family protein n=1 Tax=Roseomonas acroporae TaxID=2937791 RepID=A0A9X2BWT5_9PROT|nr:fumarylacetoacetate hydrolase family protein [Roseomonas acroporae]MCK8788143.1 fumarylacetoacetate hydrolase family protein [Roseomonas acroporae]